MSTIAKLQAQIDAEINASIVADNEAVANAINNKQTTFAVKREIDKEVASDRLAENLLDPTQTPSYKANPAQGQLPESMTGEVENVVVTGKKVSPNPEDSAWYEEYQKTNDDPGNIQFGDQEEFHTKRRFKIDTFRYNFDQGARGNRFSVDFYCPPLGFSLEGLRCVNASLPGRQLETADFSEYGPTRKLPYNLAMDGQEVTFTFVCDSSFADRYLIEAWQSAIFQGRSIQDKSYVKNLPYEDVDEESETYGQTFYEDVEFKDFAYEHGRGNSVHPLFAYYREYIGEVVIKQITRSKKDSLVYRLHEAYPTAFAAQELSAENSDIMRFECTFAFRTFDTEYKKPSNTDALNRGRRAIDAILGLGNLRKGGNSANNTLQRFNDRLGKLSGIFS